jgi:RNA polymerase primary sigma factor
MAAKKTRKKTHAKKAKARKATSKKSSKKSAKKALRRSVTKKKQASSRPRVIPKTRANEPSADEDSQGLSAVESADSESVSGLVDEGNAFEAGAVAGVERADDSDEREVRTREFPEDDVPEEYLDND